MSDDCICKVPSMGQLLDYEDVVGLDNVHEECFILKELYLEVIKCQDHECVLGTDIVDYSLFLMVGIVLGYALNKIGVIK